MNTAMKFLFRGLLMTTMLFAISAVAQDAHTTGQFQGPKANKGHVTHSARDGKSVLTLSDDFVVPDTPDPHWQVVDSDGQVYQLDKLKKKSFLGDKYQKEIVLPAYVKNVSKVIIWCAWAEANLGEASFSSPVQ
jgi:Electron transfer DM13.